MATFSDILDRPSTEIEKPKPLPQGTYACVVNGIPEHGKSAKKGTPQVTFNLKVLAAGEDVDEDALAAWMQKPDGTSRNLQDHVLKHVLYVTEDSAWRLDDFLTHLGIEKEVGSMRVRIEQATGRQVNAFVKHEPSEDGTSVFARVGNTAPAE